MSIDKRDRTLSVIIIILALALIIFVLPKSDDSFNMGVQNLKELIDLLIHNYLDLVLVAYVFICFQIAGFVELKYKQDFILISILCILLTPFSILFILQSGKDGK